jgi:hypothetical protein
VPKLKKELVLFFGLAYDKNSSVIKDAFLTYFFGIGIINDVFHAKLNFKGRSA